MRWLTLYLRSRSVPTAFAAITGTVLVLWSLGRLADVPGARDTFAMLAVLAGGAAIAPGLAGADIDLDRTASIAWPPRRAAHVILGGAVILGIVAAAVLTHPGLLTRNVFGATGLVALGAATLGASRAWLPLAAWTVLSLPFTPPLGTPPTAPTYKVLLTWTVQPPEVTTAIVMAVLLGATGTLTYALAGPRRGR
jgi:hypothetical protein